MSRWPDLTRAIQWCGVAFLLFMRVGVQDGSRTLYRMPGRQTTRRSQTLGTPGLRAVRVQPLSRLKPDRVFQQGRPAEQGALDAQRLL